MTLKHNCIIGLCVKNNEVGLPKVFENLSKLRLLFNQFLIVAYYDVSNDNSLELLKNLPKKFNLSTVIINNNTNKTLSKIRTINIANARNHILNYVYKNGTDYDLFGMMDSNDYSCQGDIKIDIIEKYLNNKELFDGWDSLSFARKGYYDKWAFSGDLFQVGCWSYRYKNLSNDPSICSVETFMDDMAEYLNKTIFLPENQGKLFEVDSAFCGFALYKKDAFKNCRYNGNFTLDYHDKELLKNNLLKYKLPDKIPIDDCEHRHFHLQAKRINNAKIMIACDQAFEEFIG